MPLYSQVVVDKCICKRLCFDFDCGEISGSTDLWNHLKAQTAPSPRTLLEQHLLDPIRTAVSDYAASPLGLKQPVIRLQDCLYSKIFYSVKSPPADMVELRHP